MKWAIITFLLMYKSSHGQYLQNEQKDKFFYELIQQNNKHKITSFYYNNNVAELELYDLAKYEITNKSIINKDKLDADDSLRSLSYIRSNFKMNPEDSLKILEYLNSIDTIYFAHVLDLIKANKTGKGIAYDYSNPKITYTNDSLILPFFTNKINLELKAKYPNIKEEEVLGSAAVSARFYKIFLELIKNRNQTLEIKLKGFIVYKEYSDWNNYLGLVGICCYILK